MFFKTRLLFLKANKTLWVKATYFALLAVITALASAYLGDHVPFDLSEGVGAKSVDTILNILASSMLAVTTFSLTTVVSAYMAATTNVTPRATKLLMEDSTAHNALSTFIGSFVFSLIAIIFLNSGFYNEKGKVLLFFVTLVVIAIILATLIRWIGHLSKLGRVGETSRQVEETTRRALRERAQKPWLGGNPFSGDPADIPEPAAGVFYSGTGYVQYIDLDKLNKLAGEQDAGLYLTQLPGSFVSPYKPLLFANRQVSHQWRQKLLGAFVVGDERNFEQDPRFGLCVLAEIASRALSAAINDHGTAIDIIGRGERLLMEYAREKRDKKTVYPRLWIPPLTVADLFSDFFAPLLPEAAPREVRIRLMKAFASLHCVNNEQFRQQARIYSRKCHELAADVMLLDTDVEQLDRLTLN